MAGSYYEQQCKKITKLYPTGIHNSLQVKYMRQEEFGKKKKVKR